MSNRKEQLRAAARKYYASEKGKEARRQYQNKRRNENPEAARAKDRAYAKAHPDRIRNNQLKVRYGITLEQWNTLFQKQGQRCALCLKTEPGNRGWATDHDHETGRIRGILCHKCNLVLGWLGDTGPKIAEKYQEIVKYLEDLG